MKRLLGLFLLPFLSSCGLALDVPMKISRFPAGDKPAKHLVILLSGRGAKADYFTQHQWVPIARESGSQADFIAPYAHFGYYMRRQLLPRLYEDVLVPAEKTRYQSISIAGISMGGLGALLTSHQYPQLIDRIYLVSPYLGSDEAQQQIREAGGLMKWHIKQENKDDWNYFIWQRLQSLLSHPQTRNKIFLAYGEQDRLHGHDILAAAMPAEQVITIPGQHKDVVFRKLWELMNQHGFLKGL